MIFKILSFSNRCVLYWLSCSPSNYSKGLRKHTHTRKYRCFFCYRYTHVSNVPEWAETEVEVVTRRNHDISIPVRRYSLEGRFWFAQFESLQTPQRRGGHLPTAQPLQSPFLVGPTYCHPVPVPGKVTRILVWLRYLHRYLDTSQGREF